MQQIIMHGKSRSPRFYFLIISRVEKSLFMKIKGKEHISLKEASLISGYSPDYIGQLIRQGKLSGSQVYTGVAWVTTREAITEYLAGKKTATTWKFSPEKMILGARIFGWVVIVIASLFSIIIFSIVVLSVDKKLGERGTSGVYAA
jgi:hypothetical protein